MNKKILIIIISIVAIIGLAVGGFFIWKGINKNNNSNVENGTKIDIEGDEYIVYENLINSIIGTSSTLGGRKTINLDVGDKITLSQLTDEEILKASFRAVYGTENLITSETGELLEDAEKAGYASTLVYEINANAIKDYAKTVYGKESLELPSEFINGYEKYILTDDIYYGRVLINATDTYEHEYFINEVTNNGDTYIITVEVFDKINAQETVETEDCALQENATEECQVAGTLIPLTFRFVYTKTGDNFTFASVERTA